VHLLDRYTQENISVCGDVAAYFSGSLSVCVLCTVGGAKKSLSTVYDKVVLLRCVHRIAKAEYNCL
jgi:hypothetical protein